MLRILAVTLTILVGCTCGSVQAALIDYGGGLIYDSDLDITWYGVPNYDNIVYNDFVTWATTLDVDGITGWRLPVINELHHLYYDELGNTLGSFTNKGPFDSLDQGFYSSTVATLPNYYFLWFNHSIFSGAQWEVNVNDMQADINGLAVHDGNVGCPVPLPGAVWLLGSGLMGLVGLRRKFKK